MIVWSFATSAERATLPASQSSGPVRKNTISEAAATLAVKQGFVTSESQAGAGASCGCHAGFGRGGPTREDGRTASDVFLTPRPPDARKNADGGFIHVVPEGTVMTRTTTPEMGQPAAVHGLSLTDPRCAEVLNELPGLAEPAVPWTPDQHAKVNKAKPIRLLSLGTGLHGPCARFEFPEGWERTIDLLSEADAYHPLFDGLPWEQRQQMHKHVRPAAVPGHDGVRKIHSPLSFTTMVPTKRGYAKDHKYFDVPAEDYAAGNLTGYRAAGEMLEHLERGHGRRLALQMVLQEALEAAREPYDDPNRRGAGAAFMSVVEEALRFLAKHSRHQQFIAAQIKQAELYMARYREREAKEKKQFVERMRAARAAKRAAKGGANGAA